jgi:hypothetical protein
LTAGKRPLRLRTAAWAALTTRFLARVVDTAVVCKQRSGLLHRYFNDQVLRQEQEIYATEGIRYRKAPPRSDAAAVRAASLVHKWHNSRLSPYRREPPASHRQPCSGARPQRLQRRHWWR